MPFPRVIDYDFSEKGSDNLKMREAVDYAILQYDAGTTDRERFTKLYNAFNGIIDESEIESIIKFTGKKSKTKYVKYRLGRSKMRLIHGEFLMLPLEPQVRTINQTAVNKKMKKYSERLALAYVKDEIEVLRNMGYQVFEGMKMPELSDEKIYNIDNIKLLNEMIMQVIIDKRIKVENIKRDFLHNFIDFTITSMAFGHVEVDSDGKVSYRVINPKFAMFEDSVYDPLMKRTPYMGEVRMMYYHEIEEQFGYKLEEKDKKRLKELAGSHESFQEYGLRKINNEMAYPVYTIEWKGLEKVIRKISYVEGSNVPYKMVYSEEYYKKNEAKIKKDVEKKLYSIETGYKQILWTSHRISRDIYLPAEKNKNLIQVENEFGKYECGFNYTGYSFSTTDGFRVSLQEMIYELEKIYDDIRFQINRELKKIRGDVMAHDDAFLPKGKRFIDVYHTIQEDGIYRYNSSAEGNQSGRDMERQAINSLNLGSGETLNILVGQAMEIERTMDRITGINENRQGLTKATMTATANMNNIEASRSITYDLFYSMQDFMKMVLHKIAEKEKFIYSQKESFLFDESEKQFLKITKELAFDNYGVYLSDGRVEQEIRQKLEMFFGAEVNAGTIRTSDIAKFLRENSFSRAIKILDVANKELEKIRLKEIEAQNQSENEKTQATIQMAQEDREDKQQHDKEMEMLKNESKKEQIMLQNGVGQSQNTPMQGAPMPPQGMPMPGAGMPI